jgi:hypothetical protein
VYTLCESGEREDAEDFGFSILERKASCPDRGVIFFCDGSGRETLIRTICEAMLRCCRVETMYSSAGSRLVFPSFSIAASRVVESNSTKSEAISKHLLPSSTPSVAQTSLESNIQALKQSTTSAFKTLLLAILSILEREVEKKEKKKTDKQYEIRMKAERKTNFGTDRREIKGRDGSRDVDSVSRSAHPRSSIACSDSNGDVKVKCLEEVGSRDMKLKEERAGEGIEEGERAGAHSSADPGPIPKKSPKRRMIQVVIVADDGDGEGDGVEDDTDQHDGAEGGGNPKKRKRKAVMYVHLSTPLLFFFLCSVRWLLRLCAVPLISFSLSFITSTLLSVFMIFSVDKPPLFHLQLFSSHSLCG